MSRDDSSLYTGITSTTFERVRLKRDVIKKQKQEERAQLQRGSDVILDRIDDELGLIPEKIWDLASVDDTEGNVKSKLIALKLYKEYLTLLRGELVGLLRKKVEAPNE